MWRVKRTFACEATVPLTWCYSSPQPAAWSLALHHHSHAFCSPLSEKRSSWCGWRFIFIFTEIPLSLWSWRLALVYTVVHSVGHFRIIHYVLLLHFICIWQQFPLIPSLSSSGRLKSQNLGGRTYTVRRDLPRRRWSISTAYRSIVASESPATCTSV